ncbi:uncharacterized protein LACBIDRAFT_332510 [Laccaria bicolor S238N-H82]|uniref:Predicted protein n=1 Tax=Laccaria bicolor (strain S238N-H82 / ATCC MYA-4686) TaxID=486041 RepID=B0DSZ5_LACBS|nr:uncharacterized protein LACBIDRAFT_332510 [Laccaria bicolor S238N-H82]EDR02406.1 predicted protein [Laccaria bicolor S238N-H82]|eukprot:XP_001887083.1 predicted protein [Laccaria bicolor S238N-H82]
MSEEDEWNPPSHHLSLNPLDILNLDKGKRQWVIALSELYADGPFAAISRKPPPTVTPIHTKVRTIQHITDRHGGVHGNQYRQSSSVSWLRGLGTCPYMMILEYRTYFNVGRSKSVGKSGLSKLCNWACGVLHNWYQEQVSKQLASNFISFNSTGPVMRDSISLVVPASTFKMSFVTLTLGGD